MADLLFQQFDIRDVFANCLDDLCYILPTPDFDLIGKRTFSNELKHIFLLYLNSFKYCYVIPIIQFLRRLRLFPAILCNTSTTVLCQLVRILFDC